MQMFDIAQDLYKKTKLCSETEMNFFSASKKL